MLAAVAAAVPEATPALLEVLTGLGFAPIVEGEIRTPAVPRMRHSGSDHFQVKTRFCVAEMYTVDDGGSWKEPGGEQGACVGSDQLGRSLGRRA